MNSELLDLNAINELKEMLDDDFSELFVVFKDNSRLNIDKLKVAHEQNNSEDMLKYAHVLKGSCGNLGLMHIYDFMVNLETYISKDENTDVSSSMLELESLYAATLSALIENDFLTE